MKQILLVRHAQSLHHIEGKVGGWYDSVLSERGLLEAELTADRLSRIIGSTPAELYTSDLKRASQTAAAISQRVGTPVIENAALREISYGEAEGRPLSWIKGRYSFPPDSNRLDHDVGIRGAETRRQVAERVYPFVSAIFDRPIATQIIVTHSFTASMVIAAWMRLPIAAIGFLSFPVKAASITMLREDAPFRSRELVTLSDVSHLSTRGHGTWP